MSQEEQVLKYMQTHGKITTMDCFYKLNITRLSEMLRRLRVKGYVIGDRWITKHSGDGTVKRYEEFWIESEPEL